MVNRNHIDTEVPAEARPAASVPAYDRPTARWATRASMVGLLAVLCFLAGFAVLFQHDAAVRSRQVERSERVAEIYQDARFWVGQEESLERKYRVEPGPEVRALHTQAEANLVHDLRSLLQLHPSHAMEMAVGGLLRLSARYATTSERMLKAVDEHRPALVIQLDHGVVDPVFGQIEDIVYSHAARATSRSLSESEALRRHEATATMAIAVAFALGLVLLAGFGLIIARFRRRLDDTRVAELTRLSEIAMTDALTGVRNHRAFHEDLARSVHRVGRTGVPVSLVILDLDRFKEVNDTLGHQAGDEHLRALADAIRVCARGSDCAYRLGGDEFAVILDNTRHWGALEFVHRLQSKLAQSLTEMPLRATAGIAEAHSFTDKDRLIRQADLALIDTKRRGLGAAIYTPDMELAREGSVEGPEDAHHVQTLAHALALAVDAKDSYTRSHCQTVAQLCALIAVELGMEPEHVGRMRLAELLHDVGKIGVPDAILNKPAKLTDEEYGVMQGHSLLGYDIVSAAEMRTEAVWIRHHHERFDGRGYPDGLRGKAIPFESRLILVADAFEAMISDRPYRKAPGKDHAIAELRTHAGRQLDPRIVEALCRVLDAGDLLGAADSTADPVETAATR